MTRTYECRNVGCSNFGIPVIVKARPLGIYWEHPHVVCECNGCEVPIVAVDGKPIGHFGMRDDPTRPTSATVTAKPMPGVATWG